jgi:hypothetical protein
VLFVVKFFYIPFVRVRGKLFILHLHSAIDCRSKIAHGKYIRFLPALARFIWLNTISAQQRPISFSGGWTVESAGI